MEITHSTQATSGCNPWLEFARRFNPELEAASCTPDQMAQMRADAYNDMQGNLTGYDCKYCNNRGYIAVVKDGDDIRRECTCMEIRRMLAAATASGMQELLHRCKFSNYEEPEQWQKIAKNTAIGYAERSLPNQWFFLCGQSGSGKTHLATATCGLMIKRHFTVRYEMWRDLLHKLEATKYKLEQQEDIMRILSDCDVLYIDDFLKTGKNVQPSDSDISYAYEIINNRYNQGKRMIISTEFMLDDIARIDEALCGRINQMSQKFRIQIAKDAAKNYRNRED